MKKLLMVLAIATFGAVNAHAFGIGIETGAGWYRGDGAGFGGAGLSLGFGNMRNPDATAAISLNIRENFFSVGGHYKWHLYSHDFIDWLQFYAAPGLEAGFSSWTGDFGYTGLSFGGRASLGLRFLLINHLDIFLSLDPRLGLQLYFGEHAPNGFGTDNIYFNIGGTLGIRWWF
ncbi:MAG: hypothetical protein FWE37_06540 [Spirochaetaceae bacterium]|nr:hypothetical protein [Spirochaetaceae bacterium]